ncbi:unnamed protein product [Alternaria alternata]
MSSVVEKGHTIRIPAESLGGEKSEKITLDEFKSKTGGDDFCVTVDDSFQYGQKKDKTNRFLVFHNKDNKPFQHRYVENTLTQLGGRAVDIIEWLGYKDINTVEEYAKRFVGDYLHNY